jgi:hypothetical protein
MLKKFNKFVSSGFDALGNSIRNNNLSNSKSSKNVKPSTSVVKKTKSSGEKEKNQDIKTNPTPRYNFIAIGGEAKRGTVSTKPEKSGHPLYTKKVTEQEKNEFRSAYNRIKNDNKKPVNSNYTYYGSQAKIPVGAKKIHRDGSVSVKNEDGSITRTSKAGQKMSHTDSKGDTKYYAKDKEVKSGYTNIEDVKKHKKFRTENKEAYQKIKKMSDEELQRKVKELKNKSKGKA